ncbi:MAG: hypothetical protein MI922_19605, partial [Bacteroidales bacterium]|nr:hypothetical protein [Bacteroidales bacterium]
MAPVRKVFDGVVVKPKDCAGVPGGTAYIDDCGECVGGTTGKEPCVVGEKDCAGVVGGTAYIDDCGECVGGTTGKEPCVIKPKDCAGVPGGTAYIDDCGECVGGTTGKEPCTPGGFDFIDYSPYVVGSSHDGNQHDKDDILAAPMVIALLGQTGLAERFVHMDYSNHLGNNNGNMAKDMATSVNGACDKWGLPKNVTFDCQKDLSGAVNNIKKVINAATANKRFFYACGGPMEVPWRGINASNQANRKNTTAISHSKWNNGHSDTPQMNHKWADIKKTGVKTIDIKDQNGTYFNEPEKDWNWLKTKGGKYAWLFGRNKKGSFDASDAGMVWFIITGRGDQNAKMAPVRKVFDGVVVKPKDCAGVPGGTAYIDDCGECVGGTTGKEPCAVGNCTDVTLSAIKDFPNFNVNGFVPAYIDNQRGALAVNAAKHKDKWAAAIATFNGESATYDITMTSMLETDGECSYKVKVNG